MTLWSHSSTDAGGCARHRAAALGLSLLFGVLVAVPAWGAPIPAAQARIIARNMIADHIAIHGSWNGVRNPVIASVELVRFRHLPVAWNVRVSPGGHLLVAYDDEFSPVLLYSERSSFEPARVSDPNSIESWIIPDTHLIYERLRTRPRVRPAEVDAAAHAAGRVGRAWARYRTSPDSFSPARRHPSRIHLWSGEPAPARTADAGMFITVVGPLLTTTWDQGSPYNTYTPGVSGGCTHTYSGCTATAVAQLMKYWNWPATGTGSHSYEWNGQTLSADFAHAYHWSSMPNALTDSSPADEIDAVARLMSDVGISVEMLYGCSGSGGSLWAAALSSLPDYFRYKAIGVPGSRPSYTSEQFFALMKEELDLPEPRPMLLETWRTDGSSGHALVIDGYQLGSTNQVHVNLGWSGYSDGYYDITNNWLGYSGTSQTLYRGVEPDDGADRLPGRPVLVSPSGTIDDPTPTYSWAHVPGATSYVLSVSVNGSPILEETVTPVQAGCYPPFRDCQVTSSKPLAPGSGSWMVRAANAAGTGADSDALGFTVELRAPAAPSDLSAMPGGPARVDLWWTDNATNETGFKVERSPDGTSGWVEVGAPGENATSFSDLSVACGTPYVYRVRASNAIGDSDYSNVAGTTAPACLPLSGDFDGDQRSDVLWRHATRGEVWIWPMNGSTVMSQSYVATVDPGYVIAGAGDLDADGKADIVWHHGTLGQVWVWLMDGVTKRSQTWVGTVPDVGYQIQHPR